MHIVTGTVTFEQGVTPPEGATVYVQLLDTSMIDAAALLVAEQVHPHVDWAVVPEQGFEFRLEAAEIQPRNRYEVSVHVDCDSDGQLNPGDYLTTQAYPVLTHGYPRHLTIEVRRIR